jgi:hypothetical protein
MKIRKRSATSFFLPFCRVGRADMPAKCEFCEFPLEEFLGHFLAGCLCALFDAHSRTQPVGCSAWSPWANSDGQLEQVTDVNDFYDEVERNIFGVTDEEDLVEFSEMSRALGLIIRWANISRDLRHVGARVAALGCLLYATDMPHGRTKLSAIAQEAGITKQAVSKWLVEFREEIGLDMSVGKSSSARQKYAAAQRRAVARGTHSSVRRKQNNAIRDANAACKALLHDDVVCSAQ